MVGALKQPAKGSHVIDEFARKDAFNGIEVMFVLDFVNVALNDRLILF